MTDEPSFTVGVSLTEREGGALRSICQWLEEDPSRIGRLYLEQLPEKAAEQEREYAERMQVVAVVACRKLAQAIEKRFGQAALGPSRLTENGADRR